MARYAHPTGCSQLDAASWMQPVGCKTHENNTPAYYAIIVPVKDGSKHSAVALPLQMIETSCA